MDDDSGVVALQRPRPPYGTTLAVLGEPAAAVDLALHVVRCAGVGSVRSVTLPQASVPPPAEVFGPCPTGESWEWMWTSSAPPRQSGEERVGDLDLGAPGTADEVKAFLAQHSPRHSAEPGDPRVRRWLGMRADGGELLATTALYEVVPS